MPLKSIKLKIIMFVSIQEFVLNTILHPPKEGLKYSITAKTNPSPEDLGGLVELT